jgi:hypothetical protein
MDKGFRTRGLRDMKGRGGLRGVTCIGVEGAQEFQSYLFN